MKNKKTSTREEQSGSEEMYQQQLADDNRRPLGSDLEKDRLLQELQVHQFELEMQNDELRSTNEELEMQRIRFLGIYELAPVGYFILDKSGNIQEVNSAGSKLLDIDKGDVLGRHFMSFVEISHRERFYFFFNDVIATRHKKSCQLEFTSQEGKMFYGQLEGIAIDSVPDGTTTCYLAIIDITERKEAVAKLEDTKERLELALEASHAGTWEYDYKSGKIYLNNSICQICGIDENKYSGEYQSFLDIVYPEERYKVDQHLRSCINREKEVNIEFSILKQGGVCQVSMRGHLVKRSDNKRFVGTIMDISEKKQLESEAQLFKVEQQRNITTAIIDTEARERTRISEALHDGVCQLLYGIKLNIQQMETPASPDHPLANMSKLVDIAIKETRNIAFKLAPSILKDFGLPITIEEICRRLSTPKFTIRSDVKGLDRRLGLSVETCAFRIIQELINNAIKHSEGDEIIIRVRKGTTLEIIVKDNGKGFEPQTLASNTQGSGLRNVISKVELYDGKFTVDSGPGKGTAVKIILRKLND